MQSNSYGKVVINVQGSCWEILQSWVSVDLTLAQVFLRERPAFETTRYCGFYTLGNWRDVFSLCEIRRSQTDDAKMTTTECNSLDTLFKALRRFLLWEHPLATNRAHNERTFDRNTRGPIRRPGRYIFDADVIDADAQRSRT